MEQKLKPIVTVRLFSGEEKCFGPGVAELLRRVEQERSLRAAANAMCMAYSKAWTIIKNAEKLLGFRLLVTSTGGKHGGGASLSPQAKKFLSAYEVYRADVCAYAAQAFAAAFVEVEE